MAIIGLGSPMMWRLGFAVAWLVGSWLFGPKQKKNEVFDPGAEEMPRWNTALRGITIPVLFGTNRVSSQIVWQHDYTVVRKETDDSQGGKMGGSGGGKGAAQTGSINYEYYWDLIYHLGMVPERYALIKGWVGAERVNNEAMAAIIGGTSGEFVFVDVNDSNRKEDEKTTMSFEDSFFYSGSGPVLDNDADYDGWSEIQTDEGVGVRWPHTLYIGFKQLALGSYPSVPQMSWEVGPGESQVDASSAVGDTDRISTEGYFSQSSWIVGDDGVKYVFAYTGSLYIYRFDPSNNQRVLHRTYTDAQLIAMYMEQNASLTSSGWQPRGVLDPHNYFLGYSGSLSGGDSHRGYHLYKIDAAGDFVCVSAIRFAHISSITYSQYNTSVVSICGLKTKDDPIILLYNGDDAFTRNQGWRLPSINQFIDFNGSSYSSTVTGYNFFDFEPETDVDFGGILGDSLHGTAYTLFKGFMWVLPYVDTSNPLLPAVNTRLYFFANKSLVQKHIDGSATRESLVIQNRQATYPNGFTGYLDIGEVPAFSTTTNWTPTLTITVDQDVFNGDGSDAQTVYPWDLYLADGVTVDTRGLSDYDPVPTVQKIVNGSNAGAYLVIFAKTLDEQGRGEYDNQTTYSTLMRYRIFAYNPNTGTHRQLHEGQFQPFERGVDLFSSGTNFETYYNMVEYDFDSGKLWFTLNVVSTTDNQVFGFIGELQIGGGGDVYPPYIVYEILTSSIFGIGLTAAQIDQTSYLAAIDYCTAQDFKVSCQFRREESVLNIIDDVLSVYGGFLVISNGVVKFKWLEYLDGEVTSVRTIDNHHLLKSRPDEPPVKITKGARQDTFNKIKVNYFDRDLEYAQNQIEEGDEVDQDFNGIRPREFPALFVMKEAMARTMARRALWANLYSRDTYSFQLGWKDHDLEPGDVITLVDSYHDSLSEGVIARIVEWKERERGKFDVTAKQEFEYILSETAEALSITSASIINKISAVPNIKDFTAYEVPREFQTGGAEVWVSWASNEFSAGAYLWLSTDGTTFAQSQKVEPYQINGILMSGLPNDDNMVENVELLLAPRSNWLTSGSVYYDQTLPEVLQSGRAVGTSLLWCGSEMMSYQGVTLVAQNRYRFGKLYRGWGGTHIHAHNSGDLCYKQGGGLFRVAINEDKIDTTIYYKVQPYNLAGMSVNITSINAKSYSITGEYFKPRPLGEVLYTGASAGGESTRGKVRHYVGSTPPISIAWERTSPINGYGAKGHGKSGYGDFSQNSIDVTFRVEVVGSGGVVVRSSYTSGTTFTYTEAQNSGDNGAWRGNCAFKVTPYNQYGDSVRTSVLSLELW